ncbi:DUF11 domain-containing protein [Modestobacter sp. I12A-02628]|uniref:DUF11 domain-containing protein n=1 Tax=Goekera deserti TaxID=2497753 RepID=A0A7K3WC30_9ACTN|nr:DUF11 domain-containing protein [Goekera deserti]MPQ97585.1 DUF11 domain-containing protein [Goekera deserti]NDI47811.1 DUF11 domain-containing protein [Goekera deserti]NEL53559.1 DUF11 domain-containing protein [Goekera deserti]
MVVSLESSRPVRAGWSALLAVVLAAGVAVVHGTPPARAAQDPVACTNAIGLVNGGFEVPYLPLGGQGFFDQSVVPGWLTTATDSFIEFWGSGFNQVPAAVGRQFAELNATQPSTLYQDLPTIPGTTMRWSLRHRGREGNDTMAVNIGPAGGTLTEQRQITDGRNAWGSHSGLYTVPAGQTTTRFAFAAVSTHRGGLSVGNFLDDVTFGTAACVVATQTVTSPTGGTWARAGDVLTHTVTASSGGGNPASSAVFTGTLPPGVSYVPGSIRVTSGGVTTALSDAPGDDVGDYDLLNRRVTVRLGTDATSSAGGRLDSGDVRVVTYQVVVNPSITAATATTEPTVSFFDPLTGSTKNARANPAVITLNPLADLTTALVRSGPGPVVAGAPVRYRATVTNPGQAAEPRGESSAFSARLTSQLPSGLGAVTATVPGGTCTVANGTLTCELGTIAKGETRTVTVDGTPAEDTPVGAALELRVTASTASRDLDATNDSASVTDPVTFSADLGVTLGATPSGPAAGTDITYAAVVTNQGPSRARTITLTDAVPAGTSYAGGDCTSSQEVGGTVLRCPVPDLGRKQSTTVTVVLRTDPSSTGQVMNTVTVSAATADPSSADNTAAVPVDLTTVADLGVTLTSVAGSTVAGQDVTHTAVVANRGPSTARSVGLAYSVVVDGAPPPAGFGVTGSVPGGNCTTDPTQVVAPATAPTVRCTLPELLPGATATVTLVTRTVPDRPGALTGTATATSTTADPQTGDNTRSLTTALTTPSDVRAVLTVRDTDDVAPTNVRLGGSTTFTLGVTNDGPATARGTTVSIAVPAGARATLDAGGPCAGLAGCTLAAIPVGTTVTLTGTLDAGTAAAGAAIVTAVATPTTADPDPANNTAEVALQIGAPALQLSVIGAIADPRRTLGAGVGDLVFWTYVVTNTGDVPVSGLDAVLPGGAAVTGATTCQPGILPVGQTTACRATAAQRVGPDDLQALEVTTTVQALGSWGGGIELRTPPATGALRTVLPLMLVPTELLTGPAPIDVELRPAAAATLVDSPGAPAGSGQPALLATALLLVGAATALALRTLHRRRA